jgi:hypothetical protein
MKGGKAKDAGADRSIRLEQAVDFFVYLRASRGECFITAARTRYRRASQRIGIRLPSFWKSRSEVTSVAFRISASAAATQST